jgi:secreted Zn-dependent insulinase-like peptidase
VTHSNDNNVILQEFVKLNKDVTEIKIPNINPVETQTALIVSYQIDFNTDMHKDVVLSFLLKSKLEHSIFAELRTKLQIG